MATIQDFIHKLEEGQGVRVVRWIALILCLAALTAVYDIREFKNFSSQEAMDMAQLGRNIAEGKGYTTDFIRPFSFHLQQRHAVQNGRGDGSASLRGAHPDITNPPVYPLLLAAVMKVLPFQYEIVQGNEYAAYQPEVLIALVNQVLFFIAVVLVFRIGLRLFDAPVAWLATLVFVLSDLFWRFSVSGLSTMLLVVILLALTWCLISMESNHREQKRGLGWLLLMAVLVGVLTALGMLTRYGFGFLILPVIAFFLAYFGLRRWALAGAALLAFLVVISPWMFRNYQLCGQPLGTAGYALFNETSHFWGNRLDRSMGADYEQAANLVSVDHLVRKFMVNSSRIFQNDLPRIGGNWVSAFFLVGLIVPFVSPALSRMRVFAVLSLLMLLVVQALGRTHLSDGSPELNTENYLVLMAPLVFIFGAGLFFTLLDHVVLPFSMMRPLLILAFVAMAFAPLGYTLLPPRGFHLAYPPYWPVRIQEVGNWMKKDELIMSDMPWAVAWYGGRQSLWATVDSPLDVRLGYRTNTKSDFFVINDYYRQIQGLYITRMTTDGKFFSQLLNEPDWGWGRFWLEAVLRTNVPPGFPLKHAPKGFLEDGQLFLTDRKRWP